MILTDGRGQVHDLGPRQLHGNEVSVLARSPLFRPMPDGASWADEKAALWLKTTFTPPTLQEAPGRAPKAAPHSGAGTGAARAARYRARHREAIAARRRLRPRPSRAKVAA